MNKTSIILLSISVLLTLMFSRTHRAKPDDLSPLSWQEAIVLIEQAKNRNEITVDEAALLRFQALVDPSKLPEKFHPQNTSSDDWGEEIDGLADWSAKMDALYIDHDQWSKETSATVQSYFAASSQVSSTRWHK